ncbi:MAG: metalloregulator ArsR/SmtB family transcription factor [Candidatus Pacebacteria bacterium]|jgi:ArsR family transcriptional regulator|nr:metalloregulator ArsR/SmtB family transcription factor [Candidatus Paceibacterota bacterium]
MKPECCNNDKRIEETRQTVELLKVVAEDNRLKILCLLKEGELCVCKIIEHLGLSQSLVSHHLKVLKDAGLIEDSKRGLWVYYSLTLKGKKTASLILKMN